MLCAAAIADPSPAQGQRCGDYETCEEAVLRWCTGAHPRADRDGDGIPCESVCPSREVVAALERELGCGDHANRTFSLAPPARGSGCNAYGSCRAAVAAWCAGDHPRADGDADGIPCENVCASRREVARVRPDACAP